MTRKRTREANGSVIWLFGHPVGHSLSPVMQNAAFRHEGLDLMYVARDIPPEDLPGAVFGLRTGRFRGANVTLPHKQAVLALLDEVDAEAESVGAVNTIVNNEGSLRGHNTDVQGFALALHSALARPAEGLSCLVLGAGGAARAVVAALVRECAARVWVANRSVRRAEELCSTAAKWGDTECTPVALHDAKDAATTCDVIVNATSLGLPDSVKELPIDVDILHSGQVLVDLVYGTESTALVRIARDKGLAAIDGKEMLVQQAALSYRLWTGRQAPIEVMRGSISDSQG